MIQLEKYNAYQKSIIDNIYLMKMIDACREPDKLRELLKDPKCDVNIEGEYGTALFHYVSEGDLEEGAQILIDAGAKINIENMKGDTPLSKSIRRSNPNMTRLMLENGADPNESTTIMSGYKKGDKRFTYDLFIRNYMFNKNKDIEDQQESLRLFIKNGVDKELLYSDYDYDNDIYNIDENLDYMIKNNVEMQKIILDYRIDLIGDVLKIEDILQELRDDNEYKWVTDSEDLGIL